MNHKDAFKALTGNQINKRNEARTQGWRFKNEGHKVTMENVKTGKKHTGYREMTKAMEWSKRVKWND